MRTLERAESDGRRYETSSLRTICSAGTAWSASVKQRLLDFIPQVALMDACGATEGVTYGLRRVTRDDRASTANFDCAGGILVLGQDGQPLAPTQVGVLAGPTPCAGYFKDADATARTFRLIDGVQYAIPGDLGRIELDGSLTLIGRGSMTINTGGEKVFPDEVEQVIKALAGVEDCLVFGVPDERFGQAVATIVQPVSGVTLTADQIVAGSKTGSGRLQGASIGGVCRRCPSGGQRQARLSSGPTTGRCGHPRRSFIADEGAISPCVAVKP